MLAHQDYVIYDLPLLSCSHTDGWEEKTVGEIATVVGGGTPDTGVDAYWNPREIWWVTPSEITACRGIYIFETERMVSGLGLEKTSMTVLPPNSVLLTSRATIGEARINKVPMATNQGFASLVAKDGTDPVFLFYLTYHLKPALQRIAAGTTYLEISRREVRKIKCLIPPPPVQEKIGRIILSVDEALDRSPNDKSLLRLKLSLLQNLITGRVLVDADN